MRQLLLASITLAALAGVAIDRVATSTEPVTTASGIGIPPGYRDWRLIAVGREEGKNDDIRAILGNDAAFAAARDGKLPYPDGSVVARLAWSFHPLEESAAAFGQPQSFVSGTPKNGVQFMVKDSARFAATGGWGFAQFNDGQPVSEAALAPCYGCHAIVAARDLVFNRFAP